MKRCCCKLLLKSLPVADQGAATGSVLYAERASIRLLSGVPTCCWKGHCLSCAAASPFEEI